MSYPMPNPTRKMTIENGVPQHGGARSLVSFSGGARGAQEAGRYAFWTGVQRVENGVEHGYTVRSLEHLAPGQRPDKHPDDPHYDQLQEILAGCLLVRPASVNEIEAWLQAHKKDAAFATEAHIGGEHYWISEDFRLVTAPR